MTIIQRTLQRILALETEHPRWTVAIAVLLAALSIGYTVRNLGFLTSQMDLISPENRLVQMSKQISSFDKLDQFVVVIENHDSARSLKFLKALVPRLRADHKHYKQIFYRVDPDQFRDWQLLYLDRKDL
ncbi:MAG TPA: hypothetical protein VJ955_05320, partial [Desulfuromonadales bacterium]|nr:hypothetical protein [Desulfuromonadales bacterium]